VRLLDSRRLTGPNLIWEYPGAVLDVVFGDVEPDLVVGAWCQQMRRILSEVGWHDEHFCVRRFSGGASLAISAPVDALYTATEINEAAWDAARDLIEGGHRQLLQRVARQLRQEARDEARPRLRRLVEAAGRCQVPVVLDTEEVSLGLGKRSRCWDLAELPHPDDVDWSELGRIPVALVTGTNGKTTTVRLLASIGEAAGLVTGVSSTDWLAVGGEIIDRDDYAGPQGARTVLRDRRCELAVLETARGGLLRRGLAVAQADAALITNIAADHIGEFGVQDLDELADVKWVVTRALGVDSVLVLNADEPLLVARANDIKASLIWFSPDPRNSVLSAHAAAGGVTCTLNRGRIVLRRGETLEAVAAVKKIPICFGGAARHNVANALGAAALAYGLGVEVGAIGRGLCALALEDNPGRANLFEVGGATVLLDFAHNPHGLQALIEMASRLPAERRLLIIGQAGDRSDEDLCALADAASGLRFDRVLLKHLDSKRRGRPEGETVAVLKRAFIAQGYRSRQIGEHRSETGALRSALRWARPGDLIVFLAHEDRDAAYSLLEDLQAANTDTAAWGGGEQC
jgi:UDP-N-acetylmuramyl tripeptide synthase